MVKILKGDIYRTQKSNVPRLVTAIKILIIKPISKLSPPVLSFKRTQEAARQIIQILAAFNGNLGAAIESQKGSPLDYGSEF